jgi:hypothetical protein
MHQTGLRARSLVDRRDRAEGHFLPLRSLTRDGHFGIDRCRLGLRFGQWGTAIVDDVACAGVKAKADDNQAPGFRNLLESVPAIGGILTSKCNQSCRDARHDDSCRLPELWSKAERLR